MILPDFSKPDPLLTFKLDDIAFVYGSKWKQRYFTKVRRRLLPAARAVGRHQPRVAPVLRAAEHRLVGAALSGRQHAAADRSALRRLPFGQLRHQDQDGHGVERRLRAVPRSGQRARRPADRREHRESGEARLRPRQRHLHSVPFAGTAAAAIRSRASTTTGRSGFDQGKQLKDFWELEEHKLGETTFTHFADGTGTQEPHAGQRLRAERDVPARRHLLQLPRLARHAERRAADQAGARPLPDLPRPDVAERAACGDARGAHASRARQRRQRVRRVPHAEDRADDRERERAQPYVRVHHRRR